MLRDEAASSLTRESPDFWVITAALADFVAQEGRGKLPVQVSLACETRLKSLASFVSGWLIIA